MLLDGVADVVATLPGYTSATFPMTALSVYPGVCDSALDCTEALQRARPGAGGRIQGEGAGDLVRDPSRAGHPRPSRPHTGGSAGVKLRVSSRLEMPFLEALGASP